MKKIKIILTLFVLTFSISHVTMAQKKENEKESNKPKAFHLQQHVMVTMKDGSQVEAVVHSHVSKKKYYVRQWHSGKEGVVHEKYIRALSEGEVAELKKTKKK
ncbi:hypothetical protein N7E81_13640 [Reichenbachiella carrageenanivorans]|uniref:Uncharacterized protein n=1 Tax=Reichenbachiella carrageenanivorans TaxID=2979869 RepID=A0ABY6CXE9_9BACT|nr:hypothetical protein [Reichenbachiella carrageenanivorans]UXX78399.1 hypothetical protein N7E81_13640 [Reichenbachiella carrageenanivorans]